MTIQRLALTLLLAASCLLARATTPIDALDVRYLPVGAMLTWASYDEEVRSFTVERSADGFSFEIVSSVEAEPGATGKYNYLDRERPDVRHYYRVIAYGRDGSSAPSPVAEAARPGTASWALTGEFSVDVTERFDFEVESADVTMLACVLYDFLGEPVRRLDLLVTPGPNTLSIPTADLSPGAFRLEVAGGNIAESVQFLKLAQESEPVDPLVRGR